MVSLWTLCVVLLRFGQIAFSRFIKEETKKNWGPGDKGWKKYFLNDPFLRVFFKNKIIQSGLQGWWTVQTGLQQGTGRSLDIGI